MTDRYIAMVVRAEPRCNLSLARIDGGGGVVLSRCEANRTNYRLQEGDKVELNIYRNGSRQVGFDARLLNPARNRRMINPPLLPCPPFFMIRIGRR